MNTVASRTFRSTPHRDSMDTWLAIVDLLTRGERTEAKDLLLAVKGIAASIIADQAPKGVPIVAACDGPRTRVYCTYDDDAIDGTDENETSLGYDPLKGDWSVSLPCQDSDLLWVQAALKTHGDRITARSISEKVVETSKNSNAALVFDPKGFLGS
ncbi:hypothetical protein [Falsigemmobacter faecalis]|uniref:Uncharacterized protein n=1 Tax=Falsigemmobacter faecalis TaxID=2488730 RepID=A0A3P3DJQ1_9RHOB|nr:hypothetical protein [Falsigemmobacter faecalis]RRH74467.1 hypothetical protein EG244_10305 [Falsigemmobacter faecalis]